MFLASSVAELGGWDTVARLAIAAGLGAAVGVERELREREAGIRTHLCVSLGACLFTLVSAYGFAGFVGRGGVSFDPTRIAAQIVTGIGFLGAGAILREGISIRGLTTAGSLWIVAGIGMAAGAGYYWAAVAGTLLTLFALWPLRYLAYRAIDRVRPTDQRLMVELRRGAATGPLLEQLGDVAYLQLDDEADRRVVTAELKTKVDERLLARVGDLDDVIGVRWRR
jgi:putative Mg2+ transporter-C (MgtC) family protein